MRAKWFLRQFVGAIALLVVGLSGCTRESLRIALAAQQRADEVQQAVVERQHEALCILLYRDLARQLESSGVTLGDEQRVILNAAWNERDLLEFWWLQNERARALRVVGVDTKLAADQSVVDLLVKALLAKSTQVESGLAALAGQLAGEAAVETSGEQGAPDENEGGTP